MKYEVVLPGRPPGGVEAAARAMAESFGIPENKAAGLLRRVPGPLTKGMEEREAVRVAYRLRKLGLAVEVHPVSAQPAATAAGRAERSSGSAAEADRPSSYSADPVVTSTSRPSPFLSQVDEAPRPIPGLDDVLSSRRGDRRHHDRRRGAAAGGAMPGSPPPATREPGRSEPPGSESPGSESPGSAPARSELPRSEQAKSVPLRSEPPEPEMPRFETPRSEPLGSESPRTVVLQTESLRSEAVRAEAAGYEHLRPRPQRRSERAADVPAEPEPEPAAAEPAANGQLSTGGATTPKASGSWRTTEPYRTGERTGERTAPAAAQIRTVRSPFGRHLLVAAVLPGLLAFAALAVTWYLVPDRSLGPALVVGIVVLALAAGCSRLVSRPLLREHDRVLAETVRISRGDLARPVQASDRYPEAVQALERIRVSLQEGLDRLRRRKR